MTTDPSRPAGPPEPPASAAAVPVQATTALPTYDIVTRLRDPNVRLAGDVRTMAAAADEIERLRAVIRVTGLRHGATDAEIDEVLYGKR